LDLHILKGEGLIVIGYLRRFLDEKRRMKKNIKAFLYILLRDYITLGQCESIMEDIGETKVIPEEPLFRYSNRKLAEYADEIIDRLEGQ
jgi:hypothetical protein